MDRIGEILSSLANRRVLVVGLARSGVAAAKVLAGMGARVTGTDLRLEVESAGELRGCAVELQLGSEPIRQVEKSDLLVLSPGVHLDSPLVAEAKRQNVPVLGELELGFRLARVPMLAVTGTNGKSTTTALCAHLLEAGGKQVFLGGNIGNPLCNLLLEKKNVDWAVVEVSSYQLEHLTSPHEFVPAIAIWLNLTPDHLERHHDMETYGRMKRRLFEGQNPAQTGIFFLDDPEVRRNLKGLPCRVLGFGRDEGSLLRDGARIVDREIRLNRLGKNVQLTSGRLLGGHNAENAAAAVLAALEAGVDILMIQKALNTFPGLPHRLEPVGEIHNVRYINDSKGTNVDATAKSLVSFNDKILLIAGGRGKGASYRPLRGLVSEHVRHLILLGEDAQRLAEDLEGTAPIHHVTTMEEAVELGAKLANPGEIVLLSPACASFDMFKDYADRGDVFSALVRKMRERG
jgi:UDP-N-acetylmuramoylalanine--D-glutamate ligase